MTLASFEARTRAAQERTEVTRGWPRSIVVSLAPKDRTIRASVTWEQAW